MLSRECDILRHRRYVYRAIRASVLCESGPLVLLYEPAPVLYESPRFLYGPDHFLDELSACEGCMYWWDDSICAKR